MVVVVVVNARQQDKLLPVRNPAIVMPKVAEYKKVVKLLQQYSLFNTVFIFEVYELRRT